MEKFETCKHVRSVGTMAVYVEPSCCNATMIKGVMVSSKKRCSRCGRWEARDERKTGSIQKQKAGDS